MDDPTLLQADPRVEEVTDDSVNDQVDHDRIITPQQEDETDPATKSIAKAGEGEERSAVFEERLRQSTEFKEHGNALFQQGDFQGAIALYMKGLYHSEFDELSYNFELMDQHRAQVDAVHLPLLVNVSICIMKVSEPEETRELEMVNECIEFCSRALKIDPKHPKALYRRGQAYLMKNKRELAIKDLRAAIEVAPKDKNIRALYNSIREDAKLEKQKQREFWQGKLNVKSANEDAKDTTVAGGTNAESTVYDGDRNTAPTGALRNEKLAMDDGRRRPEDVALQAVLDHILRPFRWLWSFCRKSKDE